MEIIEMSIKGGKRRATANIDTAKIITIVLQIVGAAAKVGLYVGTSVAVGRAVIKAAEIAQGRLVIPGGEILTIPLILALLLVGWAFRGDVERTWRQYRKYQRRRQNDRHI